MTKIKIALIPVVFIIALLALMVWQNIDYFMTKQALTLNFKFKVYTIPETANLIYWSICFFTGFLLSYFASLAFRFKTQKKLKLQAQTIKNYRETVDDLKNEVDKIKASAYSTENTSKDAEIASKEPVQSV